MRQRQRQNQRRNRGHDEEQKQQNNRHEDQRKEHEILCDCHGVTMNHFVIASSSFPFHSASRLISIVSHHSDLGFLHSDH